MRTCAPAGRAGGGEGDGRTAGDRRPGGERGGARRRAGQSPWAGRGGLPFVAQEHVVEIVVDDEQLLRQLLVGDAGDELQDPLLHGAARPVELLRKEGRQPWPQGPAQAVSNGRPGLWVCRGGQRSFRTGSRAPQDSFRGFTPPSAPRTHRTRRTQPTREAVLLAEPGFAQTSEESASCCLFAKLKNGDFQGAG